ncbi:SBBP repeat-containing protein [Cloacibacterium normanense]|uniref:SBBP repeat-containing protein n=1 Tax=Cloacibacterium normanense TaxID=237258 RepID=UPI0035B31556
MKQNYFLRLLKSLIISIFAFGTCVQFFGQTSTTIASNVDPYGIAVDSNGNVFFGDLTTFEVKKIDAITGVVTTFVSLGAYTYPYGLAVDSKGNVYVSLYTMIRKFNSDGVKVKDIGPVYSPYGLAVDGADNLYVANSGSNNVLKFPADGSASKTLGTGFKSPQAVAVDSAGNIYVADYLNQSIKKMDASGANIVTLGAGRVAQPNGVAVDSEGNIYAVSGGMSGMVKMDANGQIVSNINSVKNLPAVVIDSKDNIYVSSPRTKTVEKLVSSTTLSTTDSLTEPQVGIYPNPAKDFVTISNLKKGQEIVIYDVTGKLLYRTTATQTVMTLNTTFYKNGLYLVKIGNESMKLMVSK